MVRYRDEQIAIDFKKMVNEINGKKANGHILRRFQNWNVDRFTDRVWSLSSTKKGVVNIIIDNGLISRVCGFFKTTDAEIDWNAWKS